MYSNQFITADELKIAKSFKGLFIFAISVCLLVPHGFQSEDYHLSLENSNNKCNTGKLRQEMCTLLHTNPDKHLTFALPPLFYRAS